MVKISDFEKISGRPVVVDGIPIIQPTLRSIREVGYDEFYRYISIINADAKNMINQIFGDNEENIPNEITTYDFFMLSDNLANILIGALSFFIDGELHYSERHSAILFLSANEGATSAVKFDKDIFEDIRLAILEVGGFSTENENLRKTHMQNEKKCLDIIAKLEAGREKMRKAKGETNKSDGTELWNIIGAVSAKSQSYNLLNIWDLTICQLYDQFYRYNNEFYLGMAATRWCVWGEDNFDHEPWFKLPTTT